MRRFRVVFNGINATNWILLSEAITLDFINRYIERLSKWYGPNYQIEYKESDI